MATEKVELRGMCPTELAQALDAEVRRYLHEASVVQRALLGNPLLAEGQGKGAGLQREPPSSAP